MSETPAQPDADLPVEDRPQPKDRPWVMRTYAGHSSAADSNALYRTNLSKGQTGLSVAFDLPTQTGYDPDHVLARGEVGKVGVPIPHLGEMRRLFDDIPLAEMNTSMTINATAMWLLALYQVVAEEQAGVSTSSTSRELEDVHGRLAGTTQNDIIKEYLSRGTYVFPPEHSLRLTSDLIAYTVNHIPKWNPINICSYHLQEAGATPTQELAYALCTAISVLDTVRDSGQVAPEDFPTVVGRISFFVNAGVRFVEEMCKMRAFVQLWDEITRERYGVEDDKMRRFRYGVQVNSLGLTEAQPENNVQRIVLEMLGVTLSKDARARAVQLPAWNEALGLPRPWDQQWSLRLQQVLAFESDLLEHDDLFEGSKVVEAKVARLVAGARAEMDRVQAPRWRGRGRGVGLHEAGAGLLARGPARPHRVRRGQGRRGQLLRDHRAVAADRGPRHRDPGRRPGGRAVGRGGPEAVARGARRRRGRAGAGRADRGGEVGREPDGGHPGGGPGRRDDRGVVRGAAGGVRRVPRAHRRLRGGRRRRGGRRPGRRARAGAATGEELGSRLRLLVGKPGLDGHSNGAEQVAVRARDAGFEVVYQGIRLTPDQIVAAAVAEDVHCVGLSILSGSHMELVPAVLDGMRAQGIEDVPVVVGGIVPSGDARRLQELGRGRRVHAEGLRADRDHGGHRDPDPPRPRARRGAGRTKCVTRAANGARMPRWEERSGSPTGPSRGGESEQVGTTSRVTGHDGAFEQRLPPQPTSVAEARRQVRMLLERSEREDLMEPAVLLVSEIVTNALLHAGTEILLSGRVDERGVRIEVGDGSSHLPVAAQLRAHGRHRTRAADDRVDGRRLGRHASRPGEDRLVRAVQRR